MEPTVPASPPPPGGTDLLVRLGPRALARPAPRLTIAVAAAGCALVVLGAVVLGADGLASGDGDGASQLPGIVLSAIVVGAGFALLQREDSGPLATAGTVAAALGVPPLLFFLTFDEGSFPPYSTEAILFVSTGAWAAAYLAGPGRGRPFFLGAACFGLWASVLELVEGVFTSPFTILSSFTASFGEDDFGDSFSPDVPDPTVVGFLSLLLGAGYLFLARRCDSRGQAGVATPLTVAALFTVPFGIALLGDDLEGVGVGFALAVAGLLFARHGAGVGRRATTWIGAALVAFGLLVVVTDLIDDATPGGIALIVVGGGVVAGAEAIRRATGEPDEVAAAPAEF